jgi:hypothetical protein
VSPPKMLAFHLLAIRPESVYSTPQKPASEYLSCQLTRSPYGFLFADQPDRARLVSLGRRF